MNCSKIINQVVAFFSLVWRTLLTIILWTPGNFNHKYFTSGSNWLYFQFQSKLLLSQVAIITAMQIPLHLSVAILADASDGFSFSLRYMGIAFAGWNVLIFIASCLVQKLWPSNGYKLQYILVFLSFATSFEEQSIGLYAHEIDFFYAQRFGLLFYLLMVCTIFFHWSTLLTCFFLAFFGGNLVVSRIYSAGSVQEVSSCLYWYFLRRFIYVYMYLNFCRYWQLYS